MLFRSWLLLLRARALGTRASVVVARGLYSAGSVVVAHGLSCSVAHGIFPDQGSNRCSLHWQVDSQPLHHQGNPIGSFLPSPVMITPNALVLAVNIKEAFWEASEHRGEECSV